jgi:hypothetical protein
MVMAQRGQARHVFLMQRCPVLLEMRQRCIHIPRVPQHDHIDH